MQNTRSLVRHGCGRGCWAVGNPFHEYHGHGEKMMPGPRPSPEAQENNNESSADCSGLPIELDTSQPLAGGSVYMVARMSLCVWFDPGSLPCGIKAAGVDIESDAEPIMTQLALLLGEVHSRIPFVPRTCTFRSYFCLVACHSSAASTWTSASSARSSGASIITVCDTSPSESLCAAENGCLNINSLNVGPGTFSSPSARQNVLEWTANAVLAVNFGKQKRA